ncbi:MAG: flagellar filament capping protein FliD [Actinomycetales bacterium]|nr:flagellar filament capping protein FliD [Actinomycetales bacterium]
MSQMSISGVFSGLDTASIVSQLVSVEARQQQLVKARMSGAQKAVDAYGALVTSMKSLSSQATTLATTSAWAGTSVTSSSPTVTAGSTGLRAASVTFDVTSVARAHTLVSADTAATLQDVVADGTVTLTKDGDSPVAIEVGNGTLAEVVAAINSADQGVLAAAVQTAPGQYRLQVSSTTTGAASGFTLDDVDMGLMNIAYQGSDATISVGELNPYTITSSTNTFDSAVDGLSFTVSEKVNGVTVSSTLDGTKVADQVSDLVDSMNSLLDDLAQQTAWNAETKTGGPLLGESVVRQLQQGILSLVGDASAPGVELGRSGRVSFDRAAFVEAFEADPTAVATAFGSVSSFAAAPGVTGNVQVVRAPTNRVAGTYALQVAVAAARERWRMEPPGGIIAGQTVLIMRGSMVLSYTAGAGDTLADAVAAVNLQAAHMGLGIGAAVDGANIVLTSITAGSAAAFTASVSGGTAVQVVAGTDVQGTIDGQPATGSGTSLSLRNSTSPADGIVLSVDVSDDDVAAGGGDVGSVTYAPSFATRLSALLDDYTRTGTGLLVTSQEGRASDVKDLQAQIDAWDLRLEARRTSLTRQFTAMETLLANMQSQMSMVSGLRVNMLGGDA